MPAGTGRSDGGKDGTMVREGPAQPAPPPNEPYPAEKARGGEIVLITPVRRWVLIAGLAGGRSGADLKFLSLRKQVALGELRAASNV